MFEVKQEEFIAIIHFHLDVMAQYLGDVVTLRSLSQDALLHRLHLKFQNVT